MPEPNLTTNHVDVPLSNIATGVAETTEEFVALKISPAFPTDKISDLMWELDVPSMFRADDNRQGPDGFLPEISWHDTTRAYRATRRGLSRFVSDVEEDNADAMVKPSKAATRILTMRNLRSLELEVLTAMTTTANFIYNVTVPAAERFDQPGSSPEAYITAAQEGPIVSPNAVLMGERVWNVIRNHPETKEKYKYTGQGAVPDGLVKELLGVPNVFVSRARYNMADPNAAANYGYIMPTNDILFFYLDPTPSKETMNTAWTMWYRGSAPVSPTSKNPFYVKPTREPRRAGGGTYYDCEAWYDPANIVTSLGAYLIKSAI